MLVGGRGQVMGDCKDTGVTAGQVGVAGELVHDRGKGRQGQS